MKLTLDQLEERALRIFTASHDLRMFQEERAGVARRNGHPIIIPPSMTGRAFPIHSNMGVGIIEEAKSYLVPPKAPHLVVVAPDDTAASKDAQKAAREWGYGFFARADERSDRLPREMEVEDQVVHGLSAWRILPRPEMWRGMPEEDPEDYDELGDPGDNARLKKERDQEILAYKRTTFPVTADWVPTTSLFYYPSPFGPREVWEIREVAASDILNDWRDPQGNPLAKALYESVKAQGLDQPLPNQVVTVCFRSDAEDLQVALLDWLPYTNIDDVRPDRQFVGQQELVYECEHHLGRVPYVLFPGRQTTSMDPVFRWNGLLDTVLELIRSLDYALTQQASSARMVAWPGLILIKGTGVQLPGQGERPTEIKIDEGGVFAGLLPGDRLENPRWTSAEDFRILESVITDLQHRIEYLTIGQRFPTGAPSGFAKAVTQGINTQALTPFLKGQQLGLADAVRLALKCAWVLMEYHDFGDSIPVRFTDKDGSSRYVALTKAQAALEYDIQVGISIDVPGERAALIDELKSLKAEGWISDYSAMTRLETENVERELNLIRLERVLGSSQLFDALVGATTQRTLANLQTAHSPGIPAQGGAIPEALASESTQSPEAMARLGSGQGLTGGGVDGSTTGLMTPQEPAPGGPPGQPAGTPAPVGGTGNLENAQQILGASRNGQVP